ncbi:MAG: endonuclease/exonuclease/phosphatase family protein [Desulfobulbaceae bacterium]|nr:endonuclease/exonuclease/phosphatase family protein [Desulfobulbaceae bacterium]
MPCKVVTYNVHRCIGTDGRHDPQRIGAVLQELSPDIAALQEVESRFSDDCRVLEFLAGQNGMTAIEGPTVISSDCRYGNLLLTRYEVFSVQHIDLSYSGRERRGAIIAELVRPDDKKVRVIATHLGLRPHERRYQVKILLEAIQEDIGTAPVTILLGDINEWFLWGRPLRWLHDYFGRLPQTPTFPSKMPFLSLDRLWCHPQDRIVQISAVKTLLARTASDHLPLIGILDL